MYLKRKRKSEVVIKKKGGEKQNKFSVFLNILKQVFKQKDSGPSSIGFDFLCLERASQALMVSYSAQPHSRLTVEIS